MSPNQTGLPLGEAMYWMAEKLAWGYDDIVPNQGEALKLYKQAAKLGFSDAHIRIGEFQQHGKGTARDPNAALKSFDTAAKAGNYLAFAYLAALISRTSHLEQAQACWDRFFAKLDNGSEHPFVAADRGELLHSYVLTQLRLGLEPGYSAVLQRHRVEIASHHQKLLEHAPRENLSRLGGVSTWLEQNLGPWQT